MTCCIINYTTSLQHGKNHSSTLINMTSLSTSTNSIPLLLKERELDHSRLYKNMPKKMSTYHYTCQLYGDNPTFTCMIGYHPFRITSYQPYARDEFCIITENNMYYLGKRDIYYYNTIALKNTISMNSFRTKIYIDKRYKTEFDYIEFYYEYSLQYGERYSIKDVLNGLNRNEELYIRGNGLYYSSSV